MRGLRPRKRDKDISPMPVFMQGQGDLGASIVPVFLTCQFQVRPIEPIYPLLGR